MGLVCDVCGRPKTNSATATRLYEKDDGEIDLYVGLKLHGCNIHRAVDRVVVPDKIARREIKIAGMD